MHGLLLHKAERTFVIFPQICAPPQHNLNGLRTVKRKNTVAVQP